MIAFVLENHRIRDKYVQKKKKQKQIHTFRINQITFTYGGGKKERANFYGMFGQILPISAAFTDIENEATTVQRNRCVHTLSQTQPLRPCCHGFLERRYIKTI